MPTDSNSTILDQHQLRTTVHCLLDDARDAAGERRAESRVPFFSPVTVAVDGQQQFSCFSRDISPAGLGLLHYAPLESGEVVLTIPSRSHGLVRIQAHIVWCRPFGEGWYLSGARFLAVLPCNEANTGRKDA